MSVFCGFAIMMLYYFLSVYLVAYGAGVNAFINPYPRSKTTYFNEDAGEQLILTPFIESGKIDEARNLSRVLPLKGNVTSFSGFITVDKDCKSNLFFWLFPAETSPETGPLSVWLQGGPGSTSLFGLFNENGPFQLTSDGDIKLRDFSWTQASSFLYIDNPVGTGFSHTGRLDCYSKNQTHVGQNLLELVKQILQLFPEYSKNPFFVTGESYAGKYVPALAYAIHQHNKNENENYINLQGIAIGNGLVDPGSQFQYGDYLYQLGIIDVNDREVFYDRENWIRKYIADENWIDAFRVFDDFLNGDLISYPTLFYNVTGFNVYFNYLYHAQPPEGDVDAFVTTLEVRKAIHVGNATWNDGHTAEVQLEEDWMKSTRPWLEELLEHYRVLIYNGQLDIILAYPMTLNYLQKLNWSGAEVYQSAPRHQWKVDKDLAGYVKVAGKLTEVLVRNSGHMVPTDQPKWSLELISRFINDEQIW